MVAIEHRQKSSTATGTSAATTATINIAVLSPTSSASSVSAASNTTTTTTSSIPQQQQQEHSANATTIIQNSLKQQPHHQQVKSAKMSQLDSAAEAVSEKQQKDRLTTGVGGGGGGGGGAVSKSAVSQRNVNIKIAKKSNMDAATKELTKKVLKLDLTGKELEEYSIKSPKSPITRLPHQTSLTSSVDMEDRKTLREALYQGIFHRHRRTIFAVGSFLRMLRSRNSQYNTIRSSSEGEDVDEVR